MRNVKVLHAFEDSANLLKSGEALRKRAKDQGYLFMRGLLPSEPVMGVRHSVLKQCAKAGWVSANTNLLDGVASEEVHIVEGQPEFYGTYAEIQKLEDFHKLALHPKLIGLFQTLFDEEVLVHPRNICRVFFPHTTEYTTPAHQDFAQIGGTAETWTAWIPLGDCPMSLGGLAIMTGSHHEDVLPHHASIGVGGKALDTEMLEYEWVGGDMACGDVLVFHSHTIHRALPNTTSDRLRLSVDYRYQPSSHPVREDSLLPHFQKLTWEQIYSNWQSKEGQYFWLEQNLTVVKRE